MSETTKKQKIVVLGCGFAGLSFVKACKGLGESADILVVDKENHHLFQPLLYQVAMAGLSAPEVSEPIRAIFRRRPEVQTVMDTVEAIDLDKREVTLAVGGVERYDYLVVAMGGASSYFGHDDWEVHAPGLKSLDDAMRIRRGVLTSFELAEAIDEGARRKELITVVIIGGGATGVELAGAMAELAKRVFKRDFREINPADARVVLVDGSDRLLEAFPESLSASALRQLKSLGVEVRLNTQVDAIDGDGVDLSDGTRIDAANVLWGGGVQAVAVTRTLDVELGKGGRIPVGPDLSVPGHPEVFVLGDIADVTLPDGTKAPGLAPAAMQMGKQVGKVIRGEVKSGQGVGEPGVRPVFTYKDKGTMATIGRSRAIAWVGPLKLSGFFAWLAWLVVHLLLLIGFRNKVVVLVQWCYSYVTFRRGARIIFGKQVAVRREAESGGDAQTSNRSSEE
ncbi:NAD(P)/FAD-dependent oxidoreductase [Phycisphaeraceae bacterium D3-23]